MNILISRIWSSDSKNWKPNRKRWFFLQNQNLNKKNVFFFAKPNWRHILQTTHPYMMLWFYSINGFPLTNLWHFVTHCRRILRIHLSHVTKVVPTHAIKLKTTVKQNCMQFLVMSDSSFLALRYKEKVNMTQGQKPMKTTKIMNLGPF